MLAAGGMVRHSGRHRVFVLCCKILLIFNCGGRVACSNQEQDPTLATTEIILPTQTQAQEFSYRAKQLSSGSTAADIVLIVSSVHVRGAHDHQRWLQIAVPKLESNLKSRGIGVSSSTPNRYCLVQFGGRSRFSPPQFLNVNEQPFFPANSFVLARRQLLISGQQADGYQAIDFALRNAPFRNNSNISKMIIFVSNVGRTGDPNLSKERIGNLLRDKGVLFSAIVVANMSTTGPSSSVLGLASYNRSIAAGSNGNYQFLSGRVMFNSSQGETIRDYLTLALDVGGLVYPLQILSLENESLVESFVRSLIEGHNITSYQSKEMCEKCLCARGTGGQGRECRREQCHLAANQVHCSCLAELPSSICNLIPSPVVPTVVPTPHTVTPRQTPIILEVRGSVAMLKKRDVEVNFSSNKNRASYDCVLLDGTVSTPAVQRCSSPYRARNVPEGRHSVLVIAKRKGFFGSRVFNFEVEPEQKLELVLSEKVINGSLNGTIAVVMEVRNAVTSRNIHLMCSMGGARFFPCSSPHFVDIRDIGENGLMFIAVAVDNLNSVSLATRQLRMPILPTTPVPPTSPPPTPSGPVKILNISNESDPFGRVTVWFNTSRLDAHCLCRYNRTTIRGCVNHFTVDPKSLGPGTHSFKISCMAGSFADSIDVTITLQLPPPLLSTPLACNLTVDDPNLEGILTAHFSCDRRVIATCKVAQMTPRPCNVQNGIYEVDIQGLGGGTHLFTLNIEDSHGKSLVKIYPFTINQAYRRCCPLIDHHLSTVTLEEGPLRVDVDLRLRQGNCSESEGFSYNIDWGDGLSRETGTIHTLTNISTSYTYQSSISGDNLRVNVTFCNNPVPRLPQNKCCDTLTLSVPWPV